MLVRGDCSTRRHVTYLIYASSALTSSMHELCVRNLPIVSALEPDILEPTRWMTGWFLAPMLKLIFIKLRDAQQVRLLLK